MRNKVLVRRVIPVVPERLDVVSNVAVGVSGCFQEFPEPRT